MVLLSILLVVAYSLGGSMGERDVFYGVLVEGKPLNSGDALVLADTDCNPSQEHTELTCTAIIMDGDNVVRTRYTHPIEVPCLSRGDKVKISMKDSSTVFIIRKGKPSMEH